MGPDEKATAVDAALHKLLRGKTRGLSPSKALDKIAHEVPGFTRLEIQKRLAELARDGTVRGIDRQGVVVASVHWTTPRKKRSILT